MGMFDGILGGMIGAGMAGVVNDVLERHGGVQGVINQFQTNGLGPTVQSWVGPGANQPITPAQVHQGLGPEAIEALAAKLGIPPAELASKLAEVLPQSIDHLTPGGVPMSPWGAPPA
ncbi:YidB family protein [Phenylobacterium sp.]|uniref:YidB family protein n=1 Tax=Phenylobacterium sp. TaxID=1871053 RepID=UPI003567839D